MAAKYVWNNDSRAGYLNQAHTVSAVKLASRKYYSKVRRKTLFSTTLRILSKFLLQLGYQTSQRNIHKFLEVKYIFITHKCVHICFHILQKCPIIKVSSQTPRYSLNHHKNCSLEHINSVTLQPKFSQYKKI